MSVSERVVTFCTLLIGAMALLMTARNVWVRVLPTASTIQTVDGWREVAVAKEATADESHAITILVFSDYDCHYCRSAYEKLSEIKGRLAGQASIVWLHHPLPSHPRARPAARAAICGDRQGSLDEMQMALFLDQRHDWMGVAIQAHVSDTIAFRNCLVGDAADSVLEADLAIAASWGVRVTPTIVVDGRVLEGFDEKELLRVIQDAARRRRML